MSSIIPYTCQDSKQKTEIRWKYLQFLALCNVLGELCVSILEHFLMSQGKPAQNRVLRQAAIDGGLPAGVY